MFTVNGPLLILAGAGSGKTTVLVNRVAYMIKYGNAYFSEQTPADLSEDTVSALESALTLPAEAVGSLLDGFAEAACPALCYSDFHFHQQSRQ